MNRIEAKFRELRRKKKKALIVYITVGDPSLKATGELIPALEDAGVDIIELGIPFSDPLADGPTIQNASGRALKRGVTMKDAMRIVRLARKRSDLPIAFMTYYNPVLQYGLRRFTKDCRVSGVDGVIIPDLPFEEAQDLMRHAGREGLANVLLLAPTSSNERMAKISKLSKGFIYYVSVTGVTGARKELPGGLIAHLRKVRAKVKKPLCVGFGISRPAQAKRLAKVSDGVIVGSAVIKLIEVNAKNRHLKRKVSRFVKSLADAVHKT
ncbi:tryptophan synthase subunit alpha [Candidatus Omnitrophota bacterium]